jgi:hypothetical protein
MIDFTMRLKLASAPVAALDARTGRCRGIVVSALRTSGH